jgi:hypothetical protein
MSPGITVEVTVPLIVLAENGAVILPRTDPPAGNADDEAVIVLPGAKV